MYQLERVIKMKDNQQDTKMYVCKKCGPFCRVMREIWQPGNDSAIALEFINQSEKKLDVAFTITIGGKKIDEDKPVLRYARCGVCDSFLGEEQSLSTQFIEDFDIHFPRGLKSPDNEVEN